MADISSGSTGPFRMCDIFGRSSRSSLFSSPSSGGALKLNIEGSKAARKPDSESDLHFCSSILPSASIALRMNAVGEAPGGLIDRRRAEPRHFRLKRARGQELIMLQDDVVARVNIASNVITDAHQDL
eukprot:CAMPEP_0170579250 /NCGR_PEP_ID=MMETSP0224-20130122/5885_1 /TAXON_ID=285029 /ORGANISM="Togula jolla, Strain CCCM 725" /LENGTH=127 /DNA_ID=CAMNT_0010902265 /DNA_START=462 /DNA_END=845 /DNA_ORIENTATION=-